MSDSNVAAVALVLVLAGGQTAAAQRGGMRFQGMDGNDDGRITRAEWNGSDRSFAVHDWNGDGVLSGDEVRPGARRVARQDREQDSYGNDRNDEFDDWTLDGFRDLDHNLDNRITADEWHFEHESFRRADRDGDGVLSRGEFVNQDTAAQDDDLFARVDGNRDGAIARSEWPGSAATFDELDANRNGRLTRAELSGTAPEATPDARRSRAYEAGYERGLFEGRAAGREDRERSQGWDLEGQRELEQADSGYQARMGPREDYQAGYRDAFRLAYGEGWRRAGGR